MIIEDTKGRFMPRDQTIIRGSNIIGQFISLNPNWQYMHEYEQCLGGMLLIPSDFPSLQEGTGSNKYFVIMST